MNLADLLLNLAALLLWWGWRASGFARAAPPALVTLTALLRPARRPWYRRAVYLAALVVLLGLRAWLYWQVGSEVHWVAAMDLTVIVLPFNSASPERMALYSLGSFLLALALFYLWLLLLSVVNRRMPDTDRLQQQVRQHLGWVEHWPAVLKLLAPWVLAAGLWCAANPGLAALGLVERPASAFGLCQQALVIGAVTFLTWQYLLLAVLFVHFVNSYVYLGPGAFWGYLSDTGRNLVAPLRALPLRVGKLDLAPLAGMAVVFWGFGWAERGLRLLSERLPL
jgi:hypothetical protein